MTDAEKIAVVRGGGRVAGGISLHAAVKADAGPHVHHWRVIVCSDDDLDVCECSACGLQRVFRCDFDDEYS